MSSKPVSVKQNSSNKNKSEKTAREAHDRVFRMLAILRLIPRKPASISTTELHNKLCAQGFVTTRRQLQNDLSGEFSNQFFLMSDERVKPYRWYVDEDASQFNFPALDMPVALAFSYAERHLAHLLPHSLSSQLQPYFDQAKNQLIGDLGMARWANSLRVIPNGKALIPAPIKHDVWETVVQAFMQHCQLRISYKSRSQGEEKQLTLHPAGFVSRQAINYVVARVEGYSDIRQFALHRILSAQLIKEPCSLPDDFNIDNYIAQGAFSRQQNGATTTLVADISPQIAWLLGETPLSEQQQLEPLPNTDWQRLTATVPLDQETLWWIFALNENIRVYEPQEWAEEVKEKIKRVGEMYL